MIGVGHRGCCQLYTRGQLLARNRNNRNDYPVIGVNRRERVLASRLAFFYSARGLNREEHREGENIYATID